MTKAEDAKKDKKWRNTVMFYNDSKCAVCGKKDGRLNAHHLIPKQFKAYRWDVMNGMVLCFQHHSMGRFSAHQHPVWFVRWLMDNTPERYKWITDNTPSYEWIIDHTPSTVVY